MTYKQEIEATINSKTYTLPTPSFEGMQLGYSKVWSKNTGRAGSGKMKGTIIAIKRTLKISYKSMSAKDFDIILDAMNTRTAFFKVTYYKPSTNTVMTGTFYASDIDSSVRGVNMGDGTYSSVSFELIEQ